MARPICEECDVEMHPDDDNYCESEITKEPEKVLSPEIEEIKSILNEFGTDLENGDIFNQDDYKQLGKDIDAGHLGPIMWKASELIRRKYGRNNQF